MAMVQDTYNNEEEELHDSTLCIQYQDIAEENRDERDLLGHTMPERTYPVSAFRSGEILWYYDGHIGETSYWRMAVKMLSEYRHHIAPSPQFGGLRR